MGPEGWVMKVIIISFKNVVFDNYSSPDCIRTLRLSLANITQAESQLNNFLFCPNVFKINSIIKYGQNDTCKTLVYNVH